MFRIYFFTGGAVTANGICCRWLPAGASRQRGNEPSQALRASSPEGRVFRPLSQTLRVCQLVSFWHFVPPPPAGGVCQRESQGRGESASCLSFKRVPRAWWECFLPLPLGEVAATNGSRRRGHPAPLRGAAAAAAEGPSNRRSAKNAFSEAASIFPLRPLLWDYQGRVALDSWIQRVEIAGTFLVLFWCQKRTSSSYNPLPQFAPFLQIKNAGFLRFSAKNCIFIFCQKSSAKALTTALPRAILNT